MLIKILLAVILFLAFVVEILRCFDPKLKRIRFTTLILMSIFFIWFIALSYNVALGTLSM